MTASLKIIWRNDHYNTKDSNREKWRIDMDNTSRYQNSKLL